MNRVKGYTLTVLTFLSHSELKEEMISVLTENQILRGVPMSII